TPDPTAGLLFFNRRAAKRRIAVRKRRPAVGTGGRVSRPRPQLCCPARGEVSRPGHNKTVWPGARSGNPATIRGCLPLAAWQVAIGRRGGNAMKTAEAYPRLVQTL